jgi:uncharacterized protein
VINNSKYFLSVLFTILVLSVSAQKLPEPSQTLVTDYTNTLSEDQKQALERKLVAFDDSTSTQIAVVLINSLEGHDVADYAVRLAQKWGIGRAKKDNGVILLAALGDRKATIQTGYGVEGALPDIIARQIIENQIKPSFKQGNYYEGLEAGTNAIISYTKGEYKNENPRRAVKEGGKIPFGLIVIVIIIIFIFSRRGGGGGGRVIGSRGGADLFWWTLMSGMGRGGRSGGGGFGGFGGGGGGGGFGGFGGGGFGGGGASGDW